MAFYSFKVRSPGVLPIPGQFNALDTGINVFSAEVPDVEAFVAELTAMKVEVLETHQLDNLERVELTDMLLPDERAALQQLPEDQRTALLAAVALHGVPSGRGDPST